MAFEKGNKFWEIRSKHGRDKLFSSPEILWEAAIEYFKWCDDNPLMEAKAFAFRGIVTVESLPKMRAYTLDGLCLYLDCSSSYFRVFKSRDTVVKELWESTIDKIERTIYNQKFTGAAADLLNPVIIARDLGLAEKQEQTGSFTIAKKITFK